MSYYEYKVEPAPREAPRRKGVKATDARFAHGLAEALNSQARDGWEFQRTETLTAEASRGFLRGRTTEMVTVMVFRRWVETDAVWEPEPDYDTSERLRPRPQQQAMQDRTQIADDYDAPQPAAPRRSAPHLSAARGTDGPLHPVPGAGRG